MALVLCPECKREISSEAGTCPRCGYHITSSRSRFWAKLFWFLFVLFNVLMLLYALFNIGPMINSWDHPELGRQNRILFEAGLKLWVWGDVILGAQENLCVGCLFVVIPLPWPCPDRRPAAYAKDGSRRGAVRQQALRHAAG